MYVVFSFFYVFDLGWEDFWQQAHSSLPMSARERDGLMAKTQDWRLNSDRPGSDQALAQIWGK